MSELIRHEPILNNKGEVIGLIQEWTYTKEELTNLMKEITNDE